MGDARDLLFFREAAQNDDHVGGPSKIPATCFIPATPSILSVCPEEPVPSTVFVDDIPFDLVTHWFGYKGVSHVYLPTNYPPLSFGPGISIGYGGWSLQYACPPLTHSRPA